MEQMFDYKMIDNRSVVEQAYEIHVLTKELEQFPCVLPDKFVAGGIIAKLPPSWRDFATYLKHKRQEFSMAELIGSLNVEERARAKDTRGKALSLLVPLWCRRKIQMHLVRRRRTGKRTTQSLNKQPLLRRKRTIKMVVALFAGVMSIGQVHDQTVNLSKRRNLQT
jgi:hypothetical protein